jgi:hypothetical protein
LIHGSGVLTAVDDLLAEAVAVFGVPGVDDFDAVCALAAATNAARVRIKAIGFMIGVILQRRSTPESIRQSTLN